ncbi:hypothetical protein CC2G_011018 [Coprinopsis cinerea AmutBmut pab1-1]|nr:hypothetical protein CC2G_011018 [Coprinopsis cinerea AmutBmut pab1-1]
MDQQVSVEPRASFESLPVELFILIVTLANSSSYGISVFDVLRYMRISRQCYNVLVSAAELWTHVYFTLSRSNDVGIFLGGMYRAIERSEDRPLTLRLKINNPISRDRFNSIIRHIHSSGARWQHMHVSFQEKSSEFHVASWIPQLWKLTQESDAATTSPFTNVRTLCLDASGIAAFRGTCNAGEWPLSQLFPNLKRLVFLSLDFSFARLLPAQLAISSLQELSISGYFYGSAPYMEEEVYPTADWTLNPLRHAVLEDLHLIGDLDFIGRQVKPLECPSLSHLYLGNYASGGTNSNDLVGDVLAMVTRSQCTLDSLELDWITISNGDMVQLFTGLPHLRKIKLSFMDIEPHQALFTMLLARGSGDDHSTSFLSKLESFKVSSSAAPAELSSFVESFTGFVDDPRRGGGGPFARLQVASLKFGTTVVYSRP